MREILLGVIVLAILTRRVAGGDNAVPAVLFGHDEVDDVVVVRIAGVVGPELDLPGAIAAVCRVMEFAPRAVVGIPVLRQEPFLHELERRGGNGLDPFETVACRDLVMAGGGGADPGRVKARSPGIVGERNRRGGQVRLLLGVNSSLVGGGAL